MKKDYHVLVETLGRMISSLREKHNSRQKPHDNIQADETYLIKSTQAL